MKKPVLFLVLVFLFSFSTFAQTGKPTPAPQSFGEKITTEGALSPQQLLSQLGEKESIPAKVEGELAAVCQAKGCWATMKLPDGKTMRITFKDYAFFVPKDASGKKMIADGKAFVTTVSVKQLQHYAKDAGATESEIAKITEPERSLTFVAKGVLIQP